MASRRVAYAAAVMVAGAVSAVVAGLVPWSGDRVPSAPPDDAVRFPLVVEPPSLADLNAAINRIDPLGEEPGSFCASPGRLDDRSGAPARAPATGDPAGGLDHGDPVCTEEHGELEYRPVSSDRSALTGVAVLAGTCHAQSGLRVAHVAFAARLARSDVQFYDATFEWKLADVIGRGTVRSRGLGQPVAISPSEPLVAGVPYQWRIRETADSSSTVPWSEWFPYTLRC